MTQFASATVTGGQGVSHGGDHQLHVEFFNQAVHNPHKSEQEGRPIFEDRAYVRIVTPGSRDEVVRPVTLADQQRFVRQWERFQKLGAQSLEGTPLEQWPALGVGQVAEFKAQNIFTVEQLASLSDTGIANLGLGGREWTARARAFLDQASHNAGGERLAAENVRLRDEVQRLERRLDELATALIPPVTTAAQEVPDPDLAEETAFGLPESAPVQPSIRKSQRRRSA
ncbi:MAG: hypothetical protein HQL82_10830 [Magnetococcales bacterium]|nr:hypothetical protein [Magnetococcales bacterium]